MKIALDVNNFEELEFLEEVKTNDDGTNTYFFVSKMPVVFDVVDSAYERVQCEYYRYGRLVTKKGPSSWDTSVVSREVGFVDSTKKFVPLKSFPNYDQSYQSPDTITKFGCRADDLLVVECSDG